jgi:hypothetical protein
VPLLSVECPYKSQMAWQESDDYLENEVEIEKVLRTISKGLVEIKKIFRYSIIQIYL